MNCRRAEDMFIEYLYGELEPDRAEPLRAHLDACSACRTRLADLARVRQLVAQVPDGEPSPMAINRVIARAREEEERSRFIWGFRWVKVLAPLCLAIVIGGLVAYQFRAGLAPKSMVYAPAKEEQRAGVPEPLPAPAAGKESSPLPARDAGKLTAPAPPEPVSPKVALREKEERATPAPAAERPGISTKQERVEKRPSATEGERVNIASLPRPPVAEQGPRGTPTPQTSADSASSRPAGPEASPPTQGQAPPAALLSAPQREPGQLAAGTAAARMPAAASLEAKAVVRHKAMTPAAEEKLEASIPSLLKEGERSLEAGRFGEASQTFSQALKLLPPGHPDRPRALLGLAQAQEGKKDLTGALQTYGELAKESSTYRDLAERKIQELSAPEVK